MAPPLSSWPWANLGSFKYLLYVPVIANVIMHARGGGELLHSWAFHLVCLVGLRCLVYQLWFSFSQMFFITGRCLVIKDGVDFRQIDNEHDWDNFLILQTLIGSIFLNNSLLLPPVDELPFWNTRGFVIALLIHVAFSEPFFYWAHKCLHKGSLYSQYHSSHHSSPVPQPFTAGFATPLEHLLLVAVMGVPLLGTFLMGCSSLGLIYAHVLFFDSLRCFGYSNVEVLPHALFEAVPALKFLVYTPSYLSLHHTDKTTNFCLFMPLFDAIGGTLNPSSWRLQKEISSGMNSRVPDFVFLVHVIDVVSSMHTPFLFRSVSSNPFSTKPWMLLFWPSAFCIMLFIWLLSNTFLVSFYHLRGRLHQTWVVPRYGFQYFLHFANKGINKQIELAILRADEIGVKVLSLAALNKNEALNGGGTLFVNKHPDLRVRVVHGNTLTAAVIIHEIPRNVTNVFLTGATSKLGRAIALYLCRKRIRVMMFTLSAERFSKIQREAPAEFQQYLVQVTKYQAAQDCKTWIVGKWLSPREQRWAPSGTHFHQFVVPPMISFCRDCTYGKLAAMKLPKDVQGLGTCEYTMDRGVVHACHAGGVVHFLEGWNHHEVGAINVDQIDVVWKAALRHGLTPV